MKFSTEPFNKEHEKFLIEWFQYFNKKGWKNNSTLKDFRLDRLDQAWISFYDDKFLCFSGIEDISQWLSNTYRVMTRNVTTNVCDEKWRGKGPENNFYTPKLQVPFQVLYAGYHKPKYNVVMTCNAEVTENAGIDTSVRLAKYLNNPKNYSEFYNHDDIRIENVWYTKQYVYDINVEYAIELGHDFYGKQFYDYC